jgi:hypothetical protein
MIIQKYDGKIVKIQLRKQFSPNSITVAMTASDLR